MWQFFVQDLIAPDGLLCCIFITFPALALETCLEFEAVIVIGTWEKNSFDRTSSNFSLGTVGYHF